MSELNELYEIYNGIVQSILRNPRAVDKYGKRVSVDGEMYKVLVGYYGFDKLPEKIDDKKYDELNIKEIYHGFTDFEHGAQLLSHFNYNLGIGGYTPGLFFTDYKDVATWYTNHEQENLDENSERVLSCKVKQSSNTMKFNELQDLMVSPISDLPPNTKQEHKDKIIALHNFAKVLENEGKSSVGFLKTMKKLSNFAVYLGIDYVTEEKYNHTIIFNRGAMVIRQRENDKFLDNSVHFKNGFYDFHDSIKQNEPIIKHSGN